MVKHIRLRTERQSECRSAAKCACVHGSGNLVCVSCHRLINYLPLFFRQHTNSISQCCVHVCASTDGSCMWLDICVDDIYTYSQVRILGLFHECMGA